MREIQLQDTFKLAKLIRETNASDKIAEMLEEVNEKRRAAREKVLKMKQESEASNDEKELEEAKIKAVELKTIQEEFSKQFGIKVVMFIINVAAENNVEKMVYELLGGICEIDAEKMAKQSLKSVKEMIKQITEMNDIFDFFKDAGELAQDM